MITGGQESRCQEVQEYPDLAYLACSFGMFDPMIYLYNVPCGLCLKKMMGKSWRHLTFEL